MAIDGLRMTPAELLTKLGDKSYLGPKSLDIEVLRSMVKPLSTIVQMPFAVSTHTLLNPVFKFALS